MPSAFRSTRPWMKRRPNWYGRFIPTAHSLPWSGSFAREDWIDRRVGRTRSSLGRQLELACIGAGVIADPGDINRYVLTSPVGLGRRWPNRIFAQILAGLDKLRGYPCFRATSADQVDFSGSPTCLLLPAATSVRCSSNQCGDLSRRGFIAGAGASLASLGLFQPAAAQAAPPGPTPPIVFANFLLFDGKSERLARRASASLSRAIVSSQIATGDLTPPEGAQTIDCGGRVHDAGADRRALAYDVRGAAR